MSVSSCLMMLLLVGSSLFLPSWAGGVASVGHSGPLLWGVEPADVIYSNQTWRGNTVISPSQDVVVVDSTITVADGNVTVYGNLTFQNSHVIAETVGQASYFFVSEYGNLTLNGSTMAQEFRIVTLLNAKAEVYDSIVWDIESRNASRVRVVRSSVNSTYAFDDAIHDCILTWLAGRSVGWGNYWCPRLSFYNCTHVPIIEATNATLEVANTRIETLTTRDNVKLTFDNMTITGTWAHDGMLRWLAGRGVGWGMWWSIQWGETKASGTIDGTGTDVNIKEVTLLPRPPTGKAYVGSSMNITFNGDCNLHTRIHYTDQQVANVDISTLKLYTRLGNGWQQLQITGVNTTGKYVWGNTTSQGTTLSKWFAALGTTYGVGGIVIPIDKLALLAPYIGLASTIVAATVATAIYVKRVKRRGGKKQ